MTATNTSAAVAAAAALRRRLDMSTEYFLVPSSPSVTSSTPSPTPSTVITKAALQGFFRQEVWVIPVLALSSITMLLIAGFEVFVLCKAWKTTPSRRHLFLGQMLLLGLFCSSALAAILAAAPTQLTCAIVRFGTGVSYTIIFASLLVKCVFLISLNGGVYLPAPYQGLLLLFAILIQVAIGVQWLVTSPPLVDMVTVDSLSPKHRLLVTAEDISKPSVIPLCRTPYVDFLLSLIYVVFLISFVTVLAVKSRGIRDNYREATFIGLSVGCCIPTWLVWTVSGLIVHERHRDACIAFGLIVCSILVFLIMFMPKGRQLAAMGKEGVYVEDREDRFSTLSRAASGYSPSFFHFKPIKYGLGHGTLNHKHPLNVAAIPGVTSNLSTIDSSPITPSSQEHNDITNEPISGIGGGDSIAFYHEKASEIVKMRNDKLTSTKEVDASIHFAMYPPPPSYTRLQYHCYPSPPGYYSTRYLPGGVFLRPDDGNVYTTLEPTLSSNPNVYFQRGSATGMHPGMMY